MSSHKSLVDMGVALGRPEPKRAKKMYESTERKQLPVFSAECKYYNHDQNFGFLFVTIPANTTLDFNVETSEKDDSPNDKWQAGEVLERPIVIECFIHGSVLTKAGYRMGLDIGETLEVKVKQEDRGLQAIWTKAQEGAEVSPTQTRKNERRVTNAFLPFVEGTVKKYDPKKSFGFITTTFDPETGAALPEGETREVHFKRMMVEKAQLNDPAEGDTLFFKYWTYSDGKSNVVQFKYPERTRD